MPEDQEVNSTMGVAAIMHAGELAWQTSPSSKVTRKRYHLTGKVENGQVTSLVKYAAGATFPHHGHPGGEEILVLEGVLSDQQGDWCRGSYLLNPEGYEHAPYSNDGCLLFVKLRQYPGDRHIAFNVDQAVTERRHGCNIRILHREEDFTYLLDLKQAETFSGTFERGIEGFVLDGKCTVNEETMQGYDWFRIPPGGTLTIKASENCRCYIKEGAVAGLWSND